MKEDEQKVKLRMQLQLEEKEKELQQFMKQVELNQLRVNEIEKDLQN